jgi:hypothetical protein
MSTLSPLIDAWDEGHREFRIALEGLPNEDLWKRPHPRLLSAGELAGHVAYWQGAWIFGQGNDRPDLATLPIQSPLLDHAFRYYTGTVEQEVRLDLGTEEVVAEVMRIHDAVRAFVGDRNIEDEFPGQWKTWGNVVQYQVFHVAYHTGQIYSVRHLLGHQTEDN